MRTPNKSQSKTVSINNYKNFGLRGDWILPFLEMNEEFFHWENNHPLGEKMVPAAKVWFKQSYLIYEKNEKSTPIVELFRKHGSEYPIGWDFIWMALANNADIIKWFTVATDIGKRYTVEQLFDMLGADYPDLDKSSKNEGTTKKGGLAALKDMLTKSPLGGEDAVTQIETKGKKSKQVLAITRRARAVHPLTILYGLYIVASKAGRGSFTVRQLLTVDIDSAYVSPIVAFGIPPKTFMKQCEGLRGRYPGFISTTFSGGYDGVDVFLDKHTLDDIITLALED